MYDIIKMFYDLGFYTENDVRVFVLSGDITLEQAQEIVNGTILMGRDNQENS